MTGPATSTEEQLLKQATTTTAWRKGKRTNALYLIKTTLTITTEHAAKEGGKPTRSCSREVTVTALYLPKDTWSQVKEPTLSKLRKEEPALRGTPTTKEDLPVTTCTKL